MIYAYIPYIETGANGFSLFHKDTEHTMTRLGEINGIIYVYAPFISIQDERIAWQEVILNDEQKEILRAQVMVQSKKLFARLKVADIGDIYDLVADAMKLIEFNMMLTARLAGDLWGTNPIEETKKAEYAGRNKEFLDAVETGTITFRGDFDNMDTLMARMMNRYSDINKIVRDEYISELKRVGL